MTDWNKVFSGIIFGALAGAVAGLLLAPKPGRETRQIVAIRAVDLRQKAGDAVGTLRQKIHKGELDLTEAESNHSDQVISAN